MRGRRAAMARVRLCCLIVTLALASLLGLRWGMSRHPAPPALSTAVAKLQQALYFEPNQGQVNSDARFLARGPGYTFHVSAAEAVMKFAEAERAPVRLQYVDADVNADVVGVTTLPGHLNYYIGDDPSRWRTDVPTYARVQAEQVWSGVDVVYYGSQGRIEMDLVVAPGADPRQIRLRVPEGGALEVNDDGDLVVGGAESGVRLSRPVIYQEAAGQRQFIEGRYRVESDGQLAFTVGTYDPARALVIDPVLVYATYLGGTGDDYGFAIAVDAGGNAYVTGSTTSLDFPIANPYQTMQSTGDTYAFVTKLNANGSGLMYSTYLGGSLLHYRPWPGDFDHATSKGNGIAVDAAGNAYVAGNTNAMDFPNAGALYPGSNKVGWGEGYYSGFVTRLSPTGGLLYSTYLGGVQNNDGVGDTLANGVTVDEVGNFYVTGSTADNYFPTSNALQPTKGSPPDQQGYRPGTNAFVTKFNPTGTLLLFSTYLGGSAVDRGARIAVDAVHNVYVAGSTSSTNFPTTPTALQRNFQDASNNGYWPGDGFVAKLSASGSFLVYATYLGGNNEDSARGIAADADGNAYVTGFTSSTNFPLPADPGAALYTSRQGPYDAFVAKLSAGGSILLYGTYLGNDTGGYPASYGDDLALDAAGRVWVIGSTYSGNFPTTSDAYLGPDPSGGHFLTQLDLAANRIAYSTYLPAGGAVATGAGSGVYVAGYASAAGLPTPSGAQSYRGGSCSSNGYSYPCADAFVAKFGPPTAGGAATPTPTPTTTATRTTTLSPTMTLTNTPTATSSVTATTSASPTRTVTMTSTPTRTPTSAPTASATPSATATRPPLCGNGVIDPGEECDNGVNNSDIESNACRTDCTLPRCGDNVVDDGPPYQEDCDDGNTLDGDDCPANCKRPIVLGPRLVLGKGLCADQPQAISLHAGAANISASADVTYEWVQDQLEQTILNAVLKQVKDFIKSKMELQLPDLQTATIQVMKDPAANSAEVRFAAGDAGIGFNVIRAKRTTAQGDVYSNRILVISGLRLIEAGSLEIEPISVANAAVDVVADLMTHSFGKALPNPPMILFSQGPCSDRLSAVGRTGKAVIKDLKFNLFGGLIKDVDLIGGIEKGIGLVPGATTIEKFVKAALLGAAGEAIDFEVSSKAAQSSEKGGKAPPVTSDAVIEVTDSFSPSFPFFHGVVTAKAPGLSAVQATLDLGECLGKAADTMLVWVAPNLTKLEVRNEAGRFEDPLNVPLNGTRNAHGVGMLTAFQQGTQPIDIAFDPIGLSDVRPLIEKWIPKGKKIVQAAGMPVELTYPDGAMLAADGVYKGGDNYFGLKFIYNPVIPNITISDLRLQAAIPNLPLVTSWAMPVPPNPSPPVATVDPSAGVLTGTKRGNGQVQENVCIPFLSNDYSSDTNGVRVLAGELAVEAVVYDDLNGNGTQDADEPGLPGWTVEVLSGNGGVLASGTSDDGGMFSVVIPQEQLPVGLNTFGVRQIPRGGWTPTAPGSSGYTGLPITLGTVVAQYFGNFKDVRISGVKFADEDGSGAQEPAELGLPGWMIEFVDTYGTMHQTTTGGDGSYAFVAPWGVMNGTGQPLVREVLQAGWTPISPAGGTQELIDVAGVLESGQSLVVNFANQPVITPATPAADTPTVLPTPTPTASITPTVTHSPSPTPSPSPTHTPVAVIAGRKYDDRNGNGGRDPGDEFVAGWIIFLDDNGDGRLNNPVGGDGVCDAHATEVCVRTDEGGRYAFALSGTGVYTVREVARHQWRQTTPPPPDLVVSHAGDSYDGIDFGNQLEPARRGSGDCNTDDAVTVDEILLGVNIALGNTTIGQCPAFDGNGDGTVTVDEILKAVGNALNGLSPLPPSPTPSRTVMATGVSTSTRSATPTPTAAATATMTSVLSTPSRSATASPTRTPTGPLAPSLTPTRTVTPTRTPTVTATRTGTATPTRSRTPTATPSPTVSATPSRTATMTPSPTRTGTASPTASATVGPKAYCDSLSQPVSILDGSSTGVTNTIVVSDSPTISDLNVRLNIDHPWVGDLVVTLQHVDTGTTVTLINRPFLSGSDPDGCGEAGISATLDDSATQSVGSQCAPSTVTAPAINGGFRPVGSLSSFTGQSLSGSWQLKVADLATADAGSLLGWCLVPNTAAPTISGFTCNGLSTCTLSLGQTFTLAANFADSNGNASHSQLIAYQDDGTMRSVMWDTAGEIAPPMGSGTLAFNMSPFTCRSQYCTTSNFAFVVIVSDATGLKSTPAEVHVTVLGS